MTYEEIIKKLRQIEDDDERERDIYNIVESKVQFENEKQYEKDFTELFNWFVEQTK